MKVRGWGGREKRRGDRKNVTERGGEGRGGHAGEREQGEGEQVFEGEMI